MFRRILGAIPVAALLALSACSNTTAPEPTGTSSQEVSKQNRAVRITSPLEGASVRYSEFKSVTWEASHMHGRYTADVSMSYDGGSTYTTMAAGLSNATSIRLEPLTVVPTWSTRAVRIRVTVHDGHHDVSDEVRITEIGALSTGHRGSNRPPQQYE